jgi:hypothetical protein
MDQSLSIERFSSASSASPSSTLAGCTVSPGAGSVLGLRQIDLHIGHRRIGVGTHQAA